MIKIRLMMWADNLTYMGEMINAYKVLDGNPERKDRGQGGWGWGWHGFIRLRTETGGWFL
jgi:hypothetical protein